MGSAPTDSSGDGVAGTALDIVAGYFDRRFVLTALFPLLVVCAAAGSLAGTLVGWDEAIAWWSARSGAEQILLIVGAAAAAVFLASVVSAQAGALIRLYEGYWGRPLGKLRSWGSGRQARRLEKLNPENDVDFEIRYRFFPRRTQDLLPTRFGNILKSAELYPADDERYGMDAVFFWPRLVAVVPDNVRTALDDARASLELMLVASAFGCAFAFGSAVTLAFGPAASWVTWLIAIGGGLLIGRWAYVGSLRSAALYGDLVRTCFDLYRRDLMRQIGLEPPETLEAERALWRSLGQQLYRRAADHPELLRFATEDDAAV